VVSKIYSISKSLDSFGSNRDSNWDSTWDSNWDSNLDSNWDIEKLNSFRTKINDFRDSKWDIEKYQKGLKFEFIDISLPVVLLSNIGHAGPSRLSTFFPYVTLKCN
jgi:hypothetical protein